MAAIADIIAISIILLPLGALFLLFLLYIAYSDVRRMINRWLKRRLMSFLYGEKQKNDEKPKREYENIDHDLEEHFEIMDDPDAEPDANTENDAISWIMGRKKQSQPSRKSKVSENVSEMLHAPDQEVDRFPLTAAAQQYYKNGMRDGIRRALEITKQADPKVKETGSSVFLSQDQNHHLQEIKDAQANYDFEVAQLEIDFQKQLERWGRDRTDSEAQFQSEKAKLTARHQQDKQERLKQEYTKIEQQFREIVSVIRALRLNVRGTWYVRYDYVDILAHYLKDENDQLNIQAFEATLHVPSDRLSSVFGQPLVTLNRNRWTQDHPISFRLDGQWNNIIVCDTHRLINHQETEGFLDDIYFK